ncbi:MAG: hypothetical protein IPJ11_01670 [Gemmatimonadetes bacterium]|nr:hypothetical protein [Gemmatimonadota bacterium]
MLCLRRRFRRLDFDFDFRFRSTTVSTTASAGARRTTGWQKRSPRTRS